MTGDLAPPRDLRLVLLVGVAAPLLFPSYTNQIAVLWLMIVFASTWDILGGQMGYNSLGNIFFFGAGMYICGHRADRAVLRRRHVHVGRPHHPHCVHQRPNISPASRSASWPPALHRRDPRRRDGWIVFGLRGPYFAIGTLGVAVAGAELIASWEWVGAAGGISLPVFPGRPTPRSCSSISCCSGSPSAAAVPALALLDELRPRHQRDPRRRGKGRGDGPAHPPLQATAWAISAFFLGIAGAIFGNMTGFIEPRDIAFPTTTFNIFMVLMVLLGGKGTLWGPVIGAVVFHVIKEVTWTYFLGWQFVALGLLIVIIVVYFQQGIVGWLMEKYPERFGVRVDRRSAKCGRRHQARAAPEGAE